MVQNANSKTEEYAQLLSGSVSIVFALEGETSKLQQPVVIRNEELMQLSRSTHEMNASWNHMTVAKGALQAQFSVVESSLLLNSGMRMRTSAKMLVYEVNSRPALHARQFGKMNYTQRKLKFNNWPLKLMY